MSNNQQVSVAKYYMLKGVRCAVAARELGVQGLLADLMIDDRFHRSLFDELHQLHSPKAGVPRTDPLDRYTNVETAMSTPQGRSKLPHIVIQPLGELRQTGSIPLAHVILEP